VSDEQRNDPKFDNSELTVGGCGGLALALTIALPVIVMLFSVAVAMCC